MVLVDPLLLLAPAGGPTDRTPYQHALRDPAFRARIGERYAGGHDLLDALWWLEHPGEAGPTGAQSPDALLADARRPLYRAMPPADALRRYTVTAERERTDRASLLEALQEAEPAPPASPIAVAAEPVHGAPAAPVPTARRLVRPLALALLLVVATLGWTRAPAMPAAAAVDVPPIHLEANVGTFESPLLFTPVEPRRRVTQRPLAVVAGSTVWGLRTAGLVCVELRTGRAASGACRTVAEFTAEGLEIPYPTGSPRIGSVRWTPDGRLHLLVPR